MKLIYMYMLAALLLVSVGLNVYFVMSNKKLRTKVSRQAQINAAVLFEKLAIKSRN